MTASRHFRRAARTLALAGLAPALLVGAVVVPGEAAVAQYRQKIVNDAAKCRGNGPAVRVSVTAVKSGTGVVRAQLYRATKQDWLEKGRWIHRIEVPARAGTMSLCMPVPQPGSYAIAVRHDVNGNGETELTKDGGGVSNNPSFNIFNLGKPSYSKAAFQVGNEVKAISITLHYM